jgi:hypothetical protein
MWCLKSESRECEFLLPLKHQEAAYHLHQIRTTRRCRTPFPQLLIGQRIGLVVARDNPLSSHRSHSCSSVSSTSSLDEAMPHSDSDEDFELIGSVVVKECIINVVVSNGSNSLEAEEEEFEADTILADINLYPAPTASMVSYDWIICDPVKFDSPIPLSASCLSIFKSGLLSRTQSKLSSIATQSLSCFPASHLLVWSALAFAVIACSCVAFGILGESKFN